MFGAGIEHIPGDSRNDGWFLDTNIWRNLQIEMRNVEYEILSLIYMLVEGKGKLKIEEEPILCKLQTS